MRRTKDSQHKQAKKPKSQKDRKTLTVPKPIVQLNSLPQTNKFYIGPGNNASLVRRILSTRKNWQQVNDPNYKFLNMKWHQSSKGYKYDNSVKSRIVRQSFNHMQFHQQLSNKEHLLKSMTEYCQMHKMNVFNMLPVTYVLSLSDASYDHNQHLFLKFFEHNLPEHLKNKNRQQLMSFKRSPSLNSSCSVQRKVNYFYCKPQLKEVYRAQESQYLWILKPTFFNQGYGIHLFNQIEMLQGLMNRYISGYDKKAFAEKAISKNYTSQALQSTIEPVGEDVKSEKEDCGEDKSKLVSSPEIKKKEFRIREPSVNPRNLIKTNSFIAQKYLQKPLLINGRKFDIRVWILFTQEQKVYFFPQGYLRTSSSLYTNSQKSITDSHIHLTNNAVQKNNKDYGKYEDGNQLSFHHLENVVNGAGGSYQNLLSKMKEIVNITALSVRKKINKRGRQCCYQLFGYDFMVDCKCKPWLIEVNTNPSLEESSLLLQEIMPRMLDDAFCLTIDRMFPPLKTAYSYTIQNQSNQNLWQLIVDLKK